MKLTKPMTTAQHDSLIAELVKMYKEAEASKAGASNARARRRRKRKAARPSR